MQSWHYYLAIALIAAISPFLWTVVISVLLWIGYQVLPNRAGEIIFGHFWKKSTPPPRQTYPADSD